MNLLPLLGAALLAGCGGGDSQSNSASATSLTGQSLDCGGGSCGAAVISISDAAGDFLSYQVGLVSLKLTQADGTTVETLPTTTSIDLAALVDLSEILSTRQIPPGHYTGATVTLDYTGANIVADDGSGNGVTLSPVDESGTAITQLTVSLSFDGSQPLKISARRAASLSVDFNLASSNTVDLTAGTVTVTPVLVAALSAADSRPMRAHGALSGDFGTATFGITVCPADATSTDGSSVLTVSTTGQTLYEIDGKAYLGASGLAQLQSLGSGAMVAAFGKLDLASQSFTATEVYAGTSLPGHGRDQLVGTVLARTGMMLSVQVTDRHDGSGRRHWVGRSVGVTLADTTLVTAEGSSTAHTIADISVGQRIAVFGALSNAASLTSASSHDSSASLDASSGLVRLTLSSLWGTVGSVDSSLVTLNLDSIDGYPASRFSFAGTGASTDADPTAYQVDATGLTVSGLTAGWPARFIGFVTPFGLAPPDFSARTLVDYSATSAAMTVHWSGGSTAPFSGLTSASTSLQPVSGSSADQQFLRIGPLRIDLSTLSALPAIVPDSTASSPMYVIAHARAHDVDNFATFAGFAAALATDLNGSTPALGLYASGHYDQGANTLSSGRIVVLLQQ
ncbi:MAG: hypothetical protein QM718_08280 [Steroidobacteraceae bacterium]